MTIITTPPLLAALIDGAAHHTPHDEDDAPPARRGPGRPPLDGPPRVFKKIALTEREWATLAALDPDGRGNATRAVRHLIASATAGAQKIL